MGNPNIAKHGQKSVKSAVGNFRKSMNVLEFIWRKRYDFNFILNAVRACANPFFIGFCRLSSSVQDLTISFPSFFLRGVILSVYQGESFYNPYIPRVLEELGSKGLIEESEGARVIKIEGKGIPLIVVKRDGGYNYASTDLAALW